MKRDVLVLVGSKTDVSHEDKNFQEKYCVNRKHQNKSACIAFKFEASIQTL